jgi:polyisoprenoid-binding protein YceI
MKQSIFAAVLVSSLSVPVAFADSYTIDSTHTFPSFEINHLGFSTQRGRFNKTTGKITLDVAKKTGSIEVTIDATSLSTGLEKLEEHLRGDGFFEVAKFPTITFKSNKLNFKDNNLVSVDGDFTLHGVTKPLSLKVSHFKCGVHPIYKKEVCGADASATIKRSEFGISQFLPAVGDEVKLLIQVEAAKD